MQTMAQSLTELYSQGEISEADALAHAASADDVRSLLPQRRAPQASRLPAGASGVRQRLGGAE
jgi:Tfp pilus assembly ATPase PilU